MSEQQNSAASAGDVASPRLSISALETMLVDMGLSQTLEALRTELNGKSACIELSNLTQTVKEVDVRDGGTPVPPSSATCGEQKPCMLMPACALPTPLYDSPSEQTCMLVSSCSADTTATATATAIVVTPTEQQNAIDSRAASSHATEAAMAVSVPPRTRAHIITSANTAPNQTCAKVQEEEQQQQQQQQPTLRIHIISCDKAQALREVAEELVSQTMSCLTGTRLPISSFTCHNYNNDCTAAKSEPDAAWSSAAMKNDDGDDNAAAENGEKEEEDVLGATLMRVFTAVQLLTDCDTCTALPEQSESNDKKKGHPSSVTPGDAAAVETSAARRMSTHDEGKTEQPIDHTAAHADGAEPALSSLAWKSFASLFILYCKVLWVQRRLAESILLDYVVATAPHDTSSSTTNTAKHGAAHAYDHHASRHDASGKQLQQQEREQEQVSSSSVSSCASHMHSYRTSTLQCVAQLQASLTAMQIHTRYVINSSSNGIVVNAEDNVLRLHRHALYATASPTQLTVSVAHALDCLCLIWQRESAALMQWALHRHATSRGGWGNHSSPTSFGSQSMTTKDDGVQGTWKTSFSSHSSTRTHATNTAEKHRQHDDLPPERLRRASGAAAQLAVCVRTYKTALFSLMHVALRIRLLTWMLDSAEQSIRVFMRRQQGAATAAGQREGLQQQQHARMARRWRCAWAWLYAVWIQGCAHALSRVLHSHDSCLQYVHRSNTPEQSNAAQPDGNNCNDGDTDDEEITCNAASPVKDCNDKSNTDGTNDVTGYDTIPAALHKVWVTQVQQLITYLHTRAAAHEPSWLFVTQSPLANRDRQGTKGRASSQKRWAAGPSAVAPPLHTHGNKNAVVWHLLQPYTQMDVTTLFDKATYWGEEGRDDESVTCACRPKRMYHHSRTHSDCTDRESDRACADDPSMDCGTNGCGHKQACMHTRWHSLHQHRAGTGSRMRSCTHTLRHVDVLLSLCVGTIRRWSARQPPPAPPLRYQLRRALHRRVPLLQLYDIVTDDADEDVVVLPSQRNDEEPSHHRRRTTPLPLSIQLYALQDARVLYHQVNSLRLHAIPASLNSSNAAKNDVAATTSATSNGNSKGDDGYDVVDGAHNSDGLTNLSSPMQGNDAHTDVNGISACDIVEALVRRSHCAQRGRNAIHHVCPRRDKDRRRRQGNNPNHNGSEASDTAASSSESAGGTPRSEAATVRQENAKEDELSSQASSSANLFHRASDRVIEEVQRVAVTPCGGLVALLTTRARLTVYALRAHKNNIHRSSGDCMHANRGSTRSGDHDMYFRRNNAQGGCCSPPGATHDDSEYAEELLIQTTLPHTPPDPRWFEVSHSFVEFAPDGRSVLAAAQFLPRAHGEERVSERAAPPLSTGRICLYSLHRASYATPNTNKEDAADGDRRRGRGTRTATHARSGQGRGSDSGEYSYGACEKDEDTCHDEGGAWRLYAEFALHTRPVVCARWAHVRYWGGGWLNNALSLCDGGAYRMERVGGSEAESAANRTESAVIAHPSAPLMDFLAAPVYRPCRRNKKNNSNATRGRKQATRGKSVDDQDTINDSYYYYCNDHYSSDEDANEENRTAVDPQQQQQQQQSESSQASTHAAIRTGTARHRRRDEPLCDRRHTRDMAWRLRLRAHLSLLQCLSVGLDKVVVRWLPGSGTVLQRMMVPAMVQDMCVSHLMQALYTIDSQGAVAMYDVWPEEDSSEPWRQGGGAVRLPVMWREGDDESTDEANHVPASSAANSRTNDESTNPLGNSNNTHGSRNASSSSFSTLRWLASTMELRDRGLPQQQRRGAEEMARTSSRGLAEDADIPPTHFVGTRCVQFDRSALTPPRWRLRRRRRVEDDNQTNPCRDAGSCGSNRNHSTVDGKSDEGALHRACRASFIPASIVHFLRHRLQRRRSSSSSSGGGGGGRNSMGYGLGRQLLLRALAARTGAVRQDCVRDMTKETNLFCIPHSSSGSDSSSSFSSCDETNSAVAPGPATASHSVCRALLYRHHIMHDNLSEALLQREVTNNNPKDDDDDRHHRRSVSPAVHKSHARTTPHPHSCHRRSDSPPPIFYRSGARLVLTEIGRALCQSEQIAPGRRDTRCGPGGAVYHLLSMTLSGQPYWSNHPNSEGNRRHHTRLETSDEDEPDDATRRLVRRWVSDVGRHVRTRVGARAGRWLHDRLWSQLAHVSFYTDSVEQAMLYECHAGGRDGALADASRMDANVGTVHRHDEDEDEDEEDDSLVCSRRGASQLDTRALLSAPAPPARPRPTAQNGRFLCIMAAVGPYRMFVDRSVPLEFRPGVYSCLIFDTYTTHVVRVIPVCPVQPVESLVHNGVIASHRRARKTPIYALTCSVTVVTRSSHRRHRPPSSSSFATTSAVPSSRHCPPPIDSGDADGAGDVVVLTVGGLHETVYTYNALTGDRIQRRRITTASSPYVDERAKAAAPSFVCACDARSRRQSDAVVETLLQRTANWRRGGVPHTASSALSLPIRNGAAAAAARLVGGPGARICLGSSLSPSASPVREMAYFSQCCASHATQEWGFASCYTHRRRQQHRRQRCTTSSSSSSDGEEGTCAHVEREWGGRVDGGADRHGTRESVSSRRLSPTLIDALVARTGGGPGEVVSALEDMVGMRRFCPNTKSSRTRWDDASLHASTRDSSRDGDHVILPVWARNGCSHRYGHAHESNEEAEEERAGRRGQGGLFLDGISTPADDDDAEECRGAPHSRRAHTTHRNTEWCCCGCGGGCCCLLSGSSGSGRAGAGGRVDCGQRLARGGGGGGPFAHAQRHITSLTRAFDALVRDTSFSPAASAATATGMAVGDMRVVHRWAARAAQEWDREAALAARQRRTRLHVGVVNTVASWFDPRGGGAFYVMAGTEEGQLCMLGGSFPLS